MTRLNNGASPECRTHASNAAIKPELGAFYVKSPPRICHGKPQMEDASRYCLVVAVRRVPGSERYSIVFAAAHE